MYNEGQRNDIAVELARAGMNVRAAVRVLREDSETMRGISVMTVHRLLKKRKFTALVHLYLQRFEHERVEAAVKSERQRAEVDAAKTEFDRLDRDQRILDRLRGKIELAIEKLPVKQSIPLYARLVELTDKRLDKALPVIAGTQASQQMLDAFVETARSMLPKEMRAKFMNVARERFRKKVSEWAKGAKE